MYKDSIPSTIDDSLEKKIRAKFCSVSFDMTLEKWYIYNVCRRSVAG